MSVTTNDYFREGEVYPLYYKYPSDGYNWWRIVIQTDERTFVGVRKLHPTGYAIDPLTTGHYKPDPSWGDPISFSDAVKYSAGHP